MVPAIPIQLVSYNFSAAENPLSDSGNFTTISDADFTGSLKVIAGNLCEPATTGASGGSFWNGTLSNTPGGTFPADQYSEITLTKWSVAGSFAELVLRQGTFNSGNQYIGNLDFTNQQYNLYYVIAGSATTIVNAASQASVQGDVFRLSVVGSTITLYRNGTAVHVANDSHISSGSPGFGLLAATAITDVQTSLWAAGANQAAAPTFSLNGGSFGNPQTVTISSTTSNAGTIYYTTDGTVPTHASSSISNGGTISVNENVVVNAIASITDFADSAVATNFIYDNSVVDLFQRTSGSLGANWTNALNGFSASNKAVGTVSSATAFNLAYYSGISFTSDQSSSIVVGAIDGTASSNLGAAVRIQQGSSGAGFFSWYVALVTNAALFIYKIVNATATTAGTLTQLTTQSLTVSAGDIITLTVIGNTLTLSYNNTNTLYQATDSSSPLSGGAPGVHSEKTVATIAQWTGVSEAVASGANSVVATDGDSIVSGFGLITPWQSSLAPKSGLWSVSNIGVPARTLATCAANATTSLDYLYSATYRNNICCVWAGVNDLFSGGLSAATVYANLQTYVAARQAIGWKVIVCPMLSNVNVDAKVQTFNGLLAGNSSFANATVVLPTTLTGAGAYSNSTYFQNDGEHPNQFSANTIIAPAYNAAINSLIPAVSIANTAFPNGNQNSPYGVILIEISGTSPYTWSLLSGTLPAGLALHSTGDISGIPTTQGVSNFILQVVDSSTPAESATKAFSITIGPTTSVHTIFAPLASATNVLNVNTPRIMSPGTNVASGNVPSSNIENIDDERTAGGGSNTVVTSFESQVLTVSGDKVQGRYDSSTVINNPGRK